MEQKIPNKEELKAMVLSTNLINEKVFEEKYQEFLKAATELNNNVILTNKESGEKINFDIDANIARRFTSYISLRRKSPAKTFVGFVFGKSTKDWISQKEREVAIEMYKSDVERAIHEGYTDEQGIPLYKKGMEDKIGKEMPYHSYEMQLYMFAVREDGTGGEKLTMLTLREDTDNDVTNPFLKINIPYFKKIKFDANISDKKSTEDYTILNQSVLTKIEVIDNKEIDFKSYAMKLRKTKPVYVGGKAVQQVDLANSNFIAIDELEEWTDLKKLEKNPIKTFCVVEGVASVGSEKVVNLSDSSSFDVTGDMKSYALWLDKEGMIKIDFEDSSEIFAICKPRSYISKTGEEKIAIDTLGFWCAPMWKKKVNPEPIKDEEHVEEW